MKEVCFTCVALFCTFSVLMFSSCSSILNTVAHIQMKNPTVLTKEESLDFVRENLRSGIQEVYVVSSAPTDSAMQDAMYYYLSSPRRCFDSAGLEFDSASTKVSSCSWLKFRTFFSQDSIDTYLYHSRSAKTLDDYLSEFENVSKVDSVDKQSVTFLLGLSPDSKMPLSCKDINDLYDAWEGKCRIIVLITNPQDEWGLPKGKRVKYRMKMLERDQDVATMEIIFSYPKARK